MAKKTKPAKKIFHWNCHLCGLPYPEGTEHECVPLTERDLVRDLNEDLQDAFWTLRERASEFGEQRIYNNARAVMFSRRVCYMFVRMKKAYLELCFFLPRQVKEAPVFRVTPVTNTKFSHTVKFTHVDQLEEPLTDWLRSAYDASL
jgi:hypothetical protein